MQTMEPSLAGSRTTGLSGMSAMTERFILDLGRAHCSISIETICVSGRPFCDFSHLRTGKVVGFGHDQHGPESWLRGKFE